MHLLNDPAAEAWVDGATKGVPHGAGPLRLAAVGAQGWNLLAGDIPLPAAVIRTDILDANSAWMASLARRNGLLLAPHGKTTMAPDLFARQMRDGAWALTVATAQQMQVALRAGLRRLIFANQPIGSAAEACAQAAAAHPDLELLVLADSVAGVGILAGAVARHPAARPLGVLVEVGAAGARTGCRDVPGALAVAQAAAAAPGLALAGVEAFEGVLPDVAAVRALLDRVAEATQALDAAGLFAGRAEVVLSAGGSAFFDVVGESFRKLSLSRPVLRVLRSGCYLTHDTFGYAGSQLRVLADRLLDLPEGSLQPALHVWAYVQSRPDADKALLTMGKRDVGYDMGLPVPVARFRPGAMAAPEPVPAGWEITALNDQHAHLRLPAQADAMVGDMVCCGIAHPCTTFERWPVILLVDARYDVTGAVRTFF